MWKLLFVFFFFCGPEDGTQGLVPAIQVLNDITVVLLFSLLSFQNHILSYWGGLSLYYLALAVLELAILISLT